MLTSWFIILLGELIQVCYITNMCYDLHVFSYTHATLEVKTHWNPCPISDQRIWYSLPYFRPKLLFSIQPELQTLGSREHQDLPYNSWNG